MCSASSRRWSGWRPDPDRGLVRLARPWPDRYAQPVLGPRLVLAIVLAAVLAACGGQAPAGPGVTLPLSATHSPPATPPGTSGTPSVEPDTSGGPSSSVEPGPSGEPSSTVGPGPSDGPAESSSPGPSSAAGACTGSQDIRDFFAKAAIALPWPVLCGVLPADWLFVTGKYQLAAGGQLTVSYRGPAGATIDLSEGSFCTDGTGCVPAGTDAGDTPFGPWTGTLLNLDNGEFAIVYARGEPISWLLVAHGVDLATASAIGAAAIEVAQ